MRNCQRLLLVTTFSFLFIPPCQAQDKVVVVPLGSSLEPGTVLEGTLNEPILTVTNNESSGTLGSAISANGSSPTAPAVMAQHSGTGHALYGTSNSSYPSVEGRNLGGGPGVRGDSDTGSGVYGYASNMFQGIGVIGVQPNYSTADTSAYYTPGGFFGGRNGVIGITKADNGFGIFGWDKSSAGGWAGYFLSTGGNGVFISTPVGKTGLNVVNGTKNAVVATDDGARLMYSEESTEVWFTEYGFSQLQNDAVSVTFDPVFAQTADLSLPYHVFLQPYGNASLYVSNRTATGFEVHLQNGDANTEFSYRIVARRLGYETTRLGRAPWADNDPNLYPDQTDSATAVPRQVQQ